MIRLLRLSALVGLLSLIGCSEPRESVVLAHFDFSQPRNDETYGPSLTESVGLHYVSGDWHRPKAEAIWTGDEPAHVHLSGLGRSAELTLVWSTNPFFIVEPKPEAMGGAIDELFKGFEREIARPRFDRSRRRGLDKELSAARKTASPC